MARAVLRRVCSHAAVRGSPVRRASMEVVRSSVGGAVEVEDEIGDEVGDEDDLILVLAGRATSRSP